MRALELDTPDKCELPNAPHPTPEHPLPTKAASSLSQVTSLPLLEDLVMSTPEVHVGIDRLRTLLQEEKCKVRSRRK